MHNSNRTLLTKNRMILRIIAFLLVLILLNSGMRFLLMNNSIARVDLHRACTNSYDDLFIGTSHGMSALDPEHFDVQTGRTSTNLCMPNERLTDSYYMIRKICRNHKPQRIIYELDPSYWSCPYTNGEGTNYIYANMPAGLLKLEYAWAKNADRDFRDTLSDWHYYRGNLGQIPSRIQEKRSESYRSFSIDALSTPGQSYTQEGFLRQYADPDADKPFPDYALWDSSSYQERESIYFEKLLSFCASQGIELVVITTPVPTESYEAHRDAYLDAHEFFTAYMENHGILYLDCNAVPIEEEGFDPTLRGYLDHEGHMLVGQAEAFSTWLGRQLH